MWLDRTSLTIGALVISIGAIAVAAPASAQPSQSVPHRAKLDHDTINDFLTTLSHQKGAVGTAAKQVLVVVVPHDRREEEFVLPLLGLVENVANGKITADMAWAIPMSDRVKAEKDRLYTEHTAIIDELNKLADAARSRHDASLVAFAEAVAAHEVDDGQFVYSTAILVGQLVREKLQPNR